MTIQKKYIQLLIIAFITAVSSACGQSPDQNATNQQAVENDSGAVVSSRYSGAPLSVGDRFDMEITMDNFPVSEGGGISLKFNPAVMQIEKIDQETHWDLAYRPGEINNTKGEVSDILISSFTGNSGSVTFATIHARAVGSGTSSIDLVESVKNPFASSGNRVPVILKSASIQVD